MGHTSGSDTHAHGTSHGPLPPPEPKTPMWLTAVGIVLFLGVALMWGLSSASDAPQGTAPAASGAAPAASAAPGH